MTPQILLQIPQMQMMTPQILLQIQMQMMTPQILLQMQMMTQMAPMVVNARIAVRDQRTKNVRIVEMMPLNVLFTLNVLNAGSAEIITNVQAQIPIPMMRRSKMLFCKLRSDILN